MNDFELLDAWAAGDRRAGDALMSRHFDSVFRFLHGKACDDAEELQQRVFLACVESRDRFRRQSSFRSYLFTIARNELFGHYRRRARQTGVEVDLSTASVADLATSPSKVIAADDDRRLLLDALRRLPVDQQITIELYYWEGLSGAEVAEVLAVPSGTIRRRLTDARKSLRESVERLQGEGSTLVSTDDDLERWMRSMQARIEHS